ncbi:unnamed protein product [Arabis nemorensis]|uniref:Uncharacterized protein n=1 Tax=Arabis nemorensis TaxID=586526 RepID=A0A565CMU9_9BRAS|nr:unnamed protein product [Arabis nemorensis]
MNFYDSCPYLKFAHFTANQAILEAVATARVVHVIDLGFNQGMQWPALMQALALRVGGPPSFRLTGVGPSNRNKGIQQSGWKLAQLAQACRIRIQSSNHREIIRSRAGNARDPTRIRDPGGKFGFRAPPGFSTTRFDRKAARYG